MSCPPGSHAEPPRRHAKTPDHRASRRVAALGCHLQSAVRRRSGLLIAARTPSDGGLHHIRLDLRQIQADPRHGRASAASSTSWSSALVHCRG